MNKYFTTFFLRNLRLTCQSSAWSVLLVLLGPVAWAQAPAWQAAVAISSPGDGSAYANAVATDASGNVYVAGQFSGTLTLGSFSFSAPAGAGNNGFVAKWSPATKSFSWARQLGGVANSVAVVGSSVYAAGYFSNTASFGGTALTSAGDYDVFVVKLLDAGSSSSVAWVKQAGGVGSDQPSAIAATNSAVYVAGRFAQAASFGSTTLNAGTASNAFITKLADSGSTSAFAWAEQVVSPGTTYASGLAVAGSALYVVGRFERTATLGNSTLVTAGGAMAYVAKLLDAGTSSTVSWVQAPTSTATSMYAKGVAVAGSNVYLTGDFTGTVAFGSQALTTAGYRDIFVAKLADAGTTSTFVWAQQAGGATDELAPGLAVSGNSVYVAGSFTGTASFGATSLTSAGGGDIYVTRLIDAGSGATFAWAQQAGGVGNDSCYGMALSGTTPVLVGSFNATANFGAQAITNAALYSENAYLALLSPDVLATSAGAASISGGLYPNPAHDVVTVQVPVATSRATLTLLDGLGRVVRKVSTSAGTAYPLDVLGLAPGLYTLQVQAGESQTKQKLVVE
jgi:hypothetical protein